MVSFYGQLPLPLLINDPESLFILSARFLLYGYDYLFLSAVLSATAQGGRMFRGEGKGVMHAGSGPGGQSGTGTRPADADRSPGVPAAAFGAVGRGVDVNRQAAAPGRSAVAGIFPACPY